MSGTSASLDSVCRNCEAVLAPGQRYCGRCGQRASGERITMREIGGDLVQAIVSMDRSALSLVGALLARPGGVARDYVAGRRKRYFGPFAFLLIAVGVAAAVIAITGFKAFLTTSPNGVSDFLQRHVNFVILVQVPLLAAFTRLLFRGQRLNYAEHLVLASFTSSLRALGLGLVVVPYWYVFRPSAPELTGVYYAIWLLYFGMAGTQFYDGNRGWVWLRAVIAAVLAQATVIGLVGLTIYVVLRLRLAQ